MTETQTVEIAEEPTTSVHQRMAPWLRIGALDIDYDNTDKVLEDAGLDFTVSKRPLQFLKKDGSWGENPARMMVVRDDTEQPIDVVSKDYGVFQYTEAFEFLNHIEGRKFVAAGPLRDIKQAFMVVKLPDLDTFTVDASDPFELNVVVRTSHDRTRAVEVFTMPTRVKCTNQLPIRPYGAGITNRWAVNHIGNVGDKVHDAEVVVANVRAYVEDFKHTAKRLIKGKVTQDNARWILNKTLRETTKKDEVVANIMGLWANADTVGYSDCGWGLVNAVSDYFEHGRKGGTAQSRLLNALEGQTRGILDKVTAVTLGRLGM